MIIRCLYFATSDFIIIQEWNSSLFCNCDILLRGNRMYFTNWKSNERTKANDCKIWNHQYINVSRHTNLWYFGVLWILALLRRGNFWINNFKSSARRLVRSNLIKMTLLRFRVNHLNIESLILFAFHFSGRRNLQKWQWHVLCF